MPSTLSGSGTRHTIQPDDTALELNGAKVSSEGHLDMFTLRVQTCCFTVTVTVSADVVLLLLLLLLPPPPTAAVVVVVVVVVVVMILLGFVLILDLLVPLRLTVLVVYTGW